MLRIKTKRFTADHPCFSNESGRMMRLDAVRDGGMLLKPEKVDCTNVELWEGDVARGFYRSYQALPHVIVRLGAEPVFDITFDGEGEDLPFLNIGTARLAGAVHIVEKKWLEGVHAQARAAASPDTIILLEAINEMHDRLRGMYRLIDERLMLIEDKLNRNEPLPDLASRNKRRGR